MSCFDNGNFIHNFFDYAAARITDSYHKNIPGNIVHAKVTRIDVEFRKSSNVNLHVLLISKAVTSEA